MQQQAWKRRISKETFDYLTSDLDVRSVETAGIDAVVAEVLTKLYEVGWRGPEQPPVIDARGTKVLWRGDSGEKIPVLTSEGLLQFWKGRGHRWLILRVDQVCRGMAGPLAARLQEVLAAYEEQCEADAVDPIPEWADWRGFVGGEHPVIDADVLHSSLTGAE